MTTAIVRNQSDLEAALKSGGGDFEIAANLHIVIDDGRWHIRVATGFHASVEARGNVSVVARGNASVEARGNASVEARGNASVEARGNASVEARENASVVARGNASVEAWENASVEAWDNASVEARDNASVEARGHASVVAWDNASVVARGNASVVARGNAFLRVFSALRVTASANVAIMLHGKAREGVTGGRQIDADKPETPAEWCAFHGVTVTDGIATLFKAVDDDYSTAHARRAGISYRPGETPAAPDWDGGVAECGGGLHASPHPKMAKYGFNSGATHAIACPVRLEDIAFHPDGDYPEKVKFRGCCAPVYEVDWNGRPLTNAATEAAE